MRLRGIVVPKITVLMQEHGLASPAGHGAFYEREMRVQTDRFLNSLFELSVNIGSHTKEEGNKALSMISSTRHLVFVLIFLAVLVGAIKAWRLRVIAVQLQTDKRHLSEEAQRRQVAAQKIRQLESALDNAGDIILMFDGCRRFLYANQGALAKLGYLATEINGIDPISLHRSADEYDCEEILASLKSGESASVKM